MVKKGRIISIFLVLSLLLSTISFVGTENAYAASKKKVAKNIKVSVVSTSKNSATIKWNKIKKPYKGYAVFRNGVVIKRLGKKATSYTDRGLRSGTKYNYQVKTYKTKKVRKKKKKITKYIYKKKSNVVSASTPAPTYAPDPATDPDSLPSYIRVERDSYNVKIGESIVIRAYCNHGVYVGYTFHSGSGAADILSRDITYINGEHVENVTIKGTKVGTFVIEFKNDYPPGVTKNVKVTVLDSSGTEPTPTPSFSMNLPNTPKTLNCYWSNSSTNWARCRIDSLVLETEEIGSTVYGKVYVSGIKVGDGDYIYGKTRCAIKYKVLSESGIEFDSGILFFDAVSTNESISGTINFNCPKLDVSLELSDVFPSDLDS